MGAGLRRLVNDDSADSGRCRSHRFVGFGSCHPHHELLPGGLVWLRSSHPEAALLSDGNRVCPHQSGQVRNGFEQNRLIQLIQGGLIERHASMVRRKAGCRQTGEPRSACLSSVPSFPPAFQITGALFAEIQTVAVAGVA
jgi:hypothetical protein